MPVGWVGHLKILLDGSKTKFQVFKIIKCLSNLKFSKNIDIPPPNSWNIFVHLKII